MRGGFKDHKTIVNTLVISRSKFGIEVSMKTVSRVGHKNRLIGNKLRKNPILKKKRHPQARL